MRKVAVLLIGVSALLFFGAFAWNSDAAPLSGATTLPSLEHSLIEKAACGRRQGIFARCPIGSHWNGHAHQCVPCLKAWCCYVNGRWRCPCY
jgi:hypothetical protein